MHLPPMLESAILAMSFHLAALLLGLLSPADDLFDSLYERSREKEKELVSLRGSFTEITVSTLLAEPLVATGTVQAERPLRLQLDYLTPEKKRVSLDGDRLVVDWPERGEVEELNLAQIQKKVDRYFSRATLSELRGHFQIRASEEKGVYRVEMVPKRKQIERGLSRLVLWLDPRDLLLREMLMEFPGGDSKRFKLERLELNVPVRLSPPPAASGPAGARRDKQPDP